MSRELYSEGLKHLSSILLKAQGRPDAETNSDIDIGYECMRLREVLDAINTHPTLPQDVEEFIAEHSFYRLLTTDSEPPREGFVISVEDFRAFIARREAGHVRVPVELLEFIEAKEHHLPIEDRHVLSVMLNASKGER